MDHKKANPKKELAGSFYHPSYYHESDTLSSGIATTHEQVSDVYAEGEIGGVIETEDGKDIPLNKSGD